MGKYSVPEEIRKMRPEGTMVKNVKNHYYVYEYSSTSVKMKMPDGTFRWKTKSKTGACIGQITLQDGFVRNGIRRSDTENTVFEFGDYFLIREFAAETVHRLTEVFGPDEAKKIFVVASILVAEGFPYMKRISELYAETVLAKWYPDIDLGKDALETLCRALGKNENQAEAFGQKLIDESSKKVAIFDHIVHCPEETGDLSAFGISQKPGGPIHWMTAYDAETQLPLCNEMVNGVDPAEAMFSRTRFENTLFLVGREFNTEQDKALLSQNGNTYIVPMISGRDDYAAVYEALSFDEEMTFVYEKDGDSTQIYYKTYEIQGNPVCYHVYLDTARQSAERQMYMEKMEAGEKGYSEEGLAVAEKDFGLFLLETNDLEKTAEEVFCDYRSRGDIETLCHSIDSNPDITALCRMDDGNLRGLGFMMQIAGMIVHEINAALKPHDLSVEEVMFALRGLKLVKERNRYIVRNENKERRQLCEKIDLNTSNHGVID